MHFDVPLFLRALGLAFVLEGLCWAVFPQGMRRAMRKLLESTSLHLRVAGLCAIGAGLLLVRLAA